MSFKMRRNSFHYLVSNLIWSLGSPIISQTSPKVQQYINSLSKLEYEYLQGNEELQQREVLEYFSLIVEPFLDQTYPPLVIREVCFCTKSLFDEILLISDKTFSTVITKLLLRNLTQLSQRPLVGLFPSITDADSVLELLKSMGRFAIQQKGFSYYERMKLIDLIITFCSKFAYDPSRTGDIIEQSYRLQAKTLLSVLDFSDTRFCIYVVTQLLRARKTLQFEQKIINSIQEQLALDAKSANDISSSRKGQSSNKQNNNNNSQDKRKKLQKQIKEPNIQNDTQKLTQSQVNELEKDKSQTRSVPNTVAANTITTTDSTNTTTATTIKSGDIEITNTNTTTTTTMQKESQENKEDHIVKSGDATSLGEMNEVIISPIIADRSNDDGNTNTNNKRECEYNENVENNEYLISQNTIQQGNYQDFDKSDSDNSEDMENKNSSEEIPINRDNYCNIINEPVALNIMDCFFNLRCHIITSMPWAVKTPSVLFIRNGGELEILAELFKVKDFKFTGGVEYNICNENSNNNNTNNDEDEYYCKLYDNTAAHVLVNLLIQNMKEDIMGTLNILYRMAFHSVFIEFTPLFMYNILSLLIVLFGTTEEEYTKSDAGIIASLFDKSKKHFRFADLSSCKLKWRCLWNTSRETRRKLRWTLLKGIRDWVIEPKIFNILMENCFDYKIYCSPINAIMKFLSKVALNKNLSNSNEAKIESLLALDTITLIISKCDNNKVFKSKAEDLYQYSKYVNSKIIIHNLATALSTMKITPEGMEKIVLEHLNQLHLIGVIPKPDPHVSAHTIALLILGLPISPETRSEILSTETCANYLTEAMKILLYEDHRNFYKYDINNTYVLELVRRFSRYIALGGEGQRMERLINSFNSVAMELENKKASTGISNEANNGGNSLDNDNNENNSINNHNHNNNSNRMDASDIYPSSINANETMTNYPVLKLFLNKLKEMNNKKMFTKEDEIMFLVFGMTFLQTELNGKNKGKTKDKTTIKNKQDFAKFMANCESEDIYYSRAGLDGVFESIMEEEIRPVRDICSAFIQEEFFYNNKEIEMGSSFDMNDAPPSNLQVTLPVSCSSYSGLPITDTMFGTGNADVKLINMALNEACDVGRTNSRQNSPTINENNESPAGLVNYLNFQIQDKYSTFLHSILRLLCCTSMRILTSATKSKEIKTYLAPVEIRIKATQILARVVSCDDDLGFAIANEFLNLALHITNVMNSDILIGLNVIPVIRNYLTLTSIMISYMKRIPRSLMLNVFLVFVALDSSGKWVDVKDSISTNAKMFPFDTMPSGLLTPVDEYIKVNPLDKKKMGLLEGIWRIAKKKEKGMYYKIASFNILPSSSNITINNKTIEEKNYYGNNEKSENNNACIDYDCDIKSFYNFEDNYTPISMDTIPQIIKNSNLPTNASMPFIEIIKKGKELFKSESEASSNNAIDNNNDVPSLSVLIREEIQSSLVHNPRRSLVKMKGTSIECGGIGRWGRGSCNGNSIGVAMDKQSTPESRLIPERDVVEQITENTEEVDNSIAQDSPSNASRIKTREVSIIENQVAPPIQTQTIIGIYHTVTSKLNVSFSDFIISTLRFIGLIGIYNASRKTGKTSIYPTSNKILSNRQSDYLETNSDKTTLQIKNKVELMRKSAQVITESLLEIASSGEERFKAKYFNKIGEETPIYTSYPFTLFYNQGDSLAPFVLRITVLLTGCSAKWMLKKRDKYGLILSKIQSPTQEYISLIRSLLQKYSPSASISSPFSIVNETLDDTDVMSRLGINTRNGSSAASNNNNNNNVNNNENNGNKNNKNNKNDDTNKSQTILDIRCEPLLESSLVEATWENGEIDVKSENYDCSDLKNIVLDNIDFTSVKESLSIVNMLAKCREEWENSASYMNSNEQGIQMEQLLLSPERFVLRIPRITMFDDTVLADAVRLSCGVKGKRTTKVNMYGIDSLIGTIPPLYAKALTSPGIESEEIDALNKWWKLPGMTENIQQPLNQMFRAPLSLSLLKSKSINQIPMNESGISVESVLNNYFTILDKMLELWPFAQIEEKIKVVSKVKEADQDQIKTPEYPEKIISAVPAYSVPALIILTRFMLGEIIEKRKLNDEKSNTNKNQNSPSTTISTSKGNHTSKSQSGPFEATTTNSINSKVIAATSSSSASTPAINVASAQIQAPQNHSQIVRKFLLLMLNTTPKGVYIRGTFILQQILIPAIVSGAGLDVIGTAKIVYGNVVGSIKTVLQSEHNDEQQKMSKLSYVEAPGNEANITLLPSLLGWQLVNALICSASQSPSSGGVIAAHIKSILLIGEAENWINGEKLLECLQEIS